MSFNQLFSFTECSLPIEYCEYYPSAGKCRQWLEKNLPDVFESLCKLKESESTSNNCSKETNSDSPQAAQNAVESDSLEKKGRQKRGGKALVKTKRKDNVERFVNLARCNRGKKKYVTGANHFHPFFSFSCIHLC